jgi:hypothetical protein
VKTIEVRALFEKVVFGWLPREPVTASSESKKPSMGRTGRIASVFVFEFLVVFVSLSVSQLAGWGNYPGYAAGVVALVAVGIVVFLAWFASQVKVYRCSACGQEFRAKGLAGRVGASAVPGAAWYYTTCPKCGKRGRNLLVGYAPRTD